MKPSALVAIIVAIIIILVGWYAYATYSGGPATPSVNIDVNTTGTNTQQATSSTPTTTATSTATSTPTTSGASMSASVTLTSSGFSPKSVTIKKGGTVTWKNESTGQMWVGSASHPTHTVYSGTTLQQHCATGENKSFDQCKNGSTYSFTFDKTGSWNYHNHSNASQFGTVVVVE